MNLRRNLATTLLALLASFSAVLALVQVRERSHDAAFFAVACAAGAVGLARHASWARRYAMGLALWGVLSSAEISSLLLDGRSHGRDLHRLFCDMFHSHHFLYDAPTLGFAALFLLLLGAEMRKAYDERSPHVRFVHPAAHLVAGSLSLNVVAICALVSYAAVRTPFLAASHRAFGLAVLLSLGTFAAACGRVIGIFGMAATAIASAGLSWSDYETAMAIPRDCHGTSLLWASEAVRLLVASALGGFGSLLALAALCRPMVRFVRDKPA